MKRDNRTREERRRDRADFSAWISFGCFLGFLLMVLAHMLGVVCCADAVAGWQNYRPAPGVTCTAVNGW